MFIFSLEKGAPSLLYRDIYFKECWHRGPLKLKVQQQQQQVFFFTHKSVIFKNAVIDLHPPPPAEKAAFAPEIKEIHR